MKSLEERFWGKVNKDGSFCEKLGSRCWEWMGGKTKDGYGSIGDNWKKIYTHRLVWELVNGPIPNKLCALHKCDNPGCCNPDHLFLGTKGDNIRDCIKKCRRGNCNRKMTPEQVIEIRELRKTGLSLRKIAVMFGIHNQQIYNIVSGRHWKEVISNDP